MKERIEYLDAMRAFGIMLVVTWHIYYYGYQDTMLTGYEQYFQSFFMPIFFFISGFLAYKATDAGRGVRGTIMFIVKKFKALVVPMLVFAMAYIYMSDISLASWIVNPFKNGYWFPWSLFVFFVMYALYMPLEKLFGGGESFLMPPSWRFPC